MKKSHSVDNVIYNIAFQKSNKRSSSNYHFKKPKVCKNCLLEIIPPMLYNKKLEKQYLLSDIKPYGQQFEYIKSKQQQKISQQKRKKQSQFLKIINDRLEKDDLNKKLYGSIQLPLFQVGAQTYMEQFQLKQKKYQQIQLKMTQSNILKRKFIVSQFKKISNGQCFCIPQFDAVYWRLCSYKDFIIYLRLLDKIPMSDSMKIQAQIAMKLREKYIIFQYHMITKQW